MLEGQFDNIKCLNKLIKVEEKIYDIYMFFAQSEKEKKQNMTHISKLKELNNLYIYEKELLNQLLNDDTQLIQLYSLLDNFEDEEDNSLEFSKDETVKLYVIERILHIIEAYQSSLEANEYAKKEYAEYFDDEMEDHFYGLKIIEIDKEMERYYGKEFYVRLQERIDNCTKDRDKLIDEKYKMLFVDYIFSADVLCTGFNFKNLPKSNFEYAACVLGIEQEKYELAYLEYIFELIEEVFSNMMLLEQNEDDKMEKRIFFELADMHLEIALKSLDFVTLYEFKKTMLETLEQQGMKNSLTYVIISENFDEALNYACNYSPKLSINKAIKRINKAL